MSIALKYSESLKKSNSESHISKFSGMLFNAGMQTIDEVRRLNLELAIKRMGSAAKLADAAKTSPAYISQIKNRTPDSKTGTPKTMGDDMARRIEAALGESAGWMDSMHGGAAESAGAPGTPMVARNLIWLISKHKTNAYELQKATGIPQPTIHRMTSGESADPRTHTLQPLAAHFGLTVSDLRDRDLPAEDAGAARTGGEMSNARFVKAEVAENTDSRFVEIPMVNLKVAAGVSGFHVDAQAFDGSTMPVPRTLVEQLRVDPSQLVWVQVSGRSMEKTLWEGDLVLINLASTAPKDSAVFAVNFAGEPVIKRLTRDSGRWWLTSDNPDPQYYRRECQGDDCIIVGEAVFRHSRIL